MKKFVSLFLVCSMAFFTFGCSMGGGQSDEDLIDETLAEYLDLLIEGKFEKAAKLVEDKENSFAERMDALSGGQMEALDFLLENLEYEISDEEIDGDDCSAKLTLGIFDISGCSSISEFESDYDDFEDIEEDFEVEMFFDDDDYLYLTSDSAEDIADFILSNVEGLNISATGASAETSVLPAETTAAETTAATPAPTEVPAETEAPAPTQMGAYYEEEIADVIDTNDVDGQLLIFGFNDEFLSRVNEFSSVTYDDCQLTPNDGSAYTILLDQVLASGEGAPDIFACDADYCKKYIYSDATVSINSLGIAYAELSEMYNYTLRFGADESGVIKGLTWQACPCGVFYNRTVAQATLGVSEPEDVAPYFASWDAFLETAYMVADAGNYRIVSGWDDVYRSFLNSRTTGWVVEGAVNIDPAIQDFFDIALALYDYGLTWQTSQWSIDWSANASNGSVLSYWGPMWLGYSLGFYDSSNPTAGDWGMVSAPTNWYWGGTWVMASRYTDKKASVAQIMRDVCINPSTLSAINSEYGDFVNSISIMTAVATDYNAGAVSWLGGQNPFGVLLETARTIDNSMIGIDDSSINSIFTSVVSSYVQGDIASVAEAEAEFVNQVVAGGYANC